MGRRRAKGEQSPPSVTKGSEVTNRLIPALEGRKSNFARLHGLLATFGEVESMGTFTREMEKPSPSDGAVFLTVPLTGKRGETFEGPRFTKCGQEPECGLIGSDCGFEPPLVGAECEPKTPLVCGSGYHCLRAVTPTWA
jgi:hypothetical protein